MIQFRDNKMVETNEETPFDRMGSFYGSIVNLETPNKDDEGIPMLNETYFDNKSNETMAEKSELIVTISQVCDLR